MIFHHVFISLWIDTDRLFAAIESAIVPWIVGADLAVVVLV